MKIQKIWICTVIIGYILLFLEIAILDGGFLLAFLGIFLSLIGTIGACITSKKFREWLVVIIDAPCFWF